jgi:hypothetical protein
MSAIELFNTPLYTDPNLQFYARFENNIEDSSDNNYDLTDSGSSDSASGKFGNCRSFTRASNQYCYKATPANLIITGSQTFMAWVKPSGNGVFQMIAGVSDAGGSNIVGIGITNADKAIFYCYGLNITSVNSSVSIDTSDFHFIAGRYNANTHQIAIFIDGSVTEIDVTGSHSAGGDLGIGVLGGYLADYFGGLIDEISIFDKALTNEEIDNYYTGVWESSSVSSSLSQSMSGSFSGSASSSSSGSASASATLSPSSSMSASPSPTQSPSASASSSESPSPSPPIYIDKYSILGNTYNDKFSATGNTYNDKYRSFT